jgi:hypothetical protein
MNGERRTWLSTVAPGLGLLMAWPRLARAQPNEPPLRLEGRSLARRATVGGVDLRLNGAGVRAVAWLKAFVAALYLGAPARSPDEVLATPGPKRLQLHLLTDVQAAELSKALRRGVARNTPTPERQRVDDALADLAARIEALGLLRKGDVMQLDWDPPRGVLLALNGTLDRGAREGLAPAQPALYAAVLRAFIGEHPYDERLKAGLLSPPRNP